MPDTERQDLIVAKLRRKVHLDRVGGPNIQLRAFSHSQPTETSEGSVSSAAPTSCRTAEGRRRLEMGGGDSIPIISCFDWQRLNARPSRDLSRVGGRNKEPRCPLIDGYNYLPFEEKKRGKEGKKRSPQHQMKNSISFLPKKLHSTHLGFFFPQ